MFKKNDIVKVEVCDIGAGGEGIGKAEGFTFFVKHTVPGDIVEAVVTKVRKSYGYAKVLKVIKASPDRVEPPCENAARCGGCQLMEMSYERQLRFKEDKVREDLRRIGGLDSLPPLGGGGCRRQTDEGSHIPTPVRYRNKLQFPIGRSKNGRVIAGFYAGRTHSIIDTEDCAAAPESGAKILMAVKRFIEDNEISVYDEKSGHGLVRHLMIRTGFRSGEVMVCLVINGDHLQDKKTEDAFVRILRELELDDAVTEHSADKHLSDPETSCAEEYRHLPKIGSICLNINKDNTNVIMGRETRVIYGKGYIMDELCVDNRRLRFKISPLSFYQVNPVQAERLYEKAFEFADLKGDENVWDLYCGIGTISLFAAKYAGQVTGVEYVSEAIEDAEENAAMNGIENAGFICGRAEEIFPEKGSEADVVILDPPRKGCDAVLLDALKKVGPEKIVYISCDSATLARDLKILTRPDGVCYKIEKLTWTDMFSNTVHCEVVCLMSKV